MLGLFPVLSKSQQIFMMHDNGQIKLIDIATMQARCKFSPFIKTSNRKKGLNMSYQQVKTLMQKSLWRASGGFRSTPSATAMASELGICVFADQEQLQFYDVSDRRLVAHQKVRDMMYDCIFASFRCKMNKVAMPEGARYLCGILQ